MTWALVLFLGFWCLSLADPSRACYAEVGRYATSAACAKARQELVIAPGEGRTAWCERR